MPAPDGPDPALWDKVVKELTPILNELGQFSVDRITQQISVPWPGLTHAETGHELPYQRDGKLIAGLGFGVTSDASSVTLRIVSNRPGKYPDVPEWLEWGIAGKFEQLPYMRPEKERLGGESAEFIQNRIDSK